jgi:hypothetical protein
MGAAFFSSESRPSPPVTPCPNLPATVQHGATSARVVTPLAQKHARRLLRQRGVTASDLSPLGRGLLHNWARVAAQLQLLDQHAERVGGLIDTETGEPRPFVNLWLRLVEAERRSLVAMAQHIDKRDGNPRAELHAYIEGNYGDAA